MSENRDQQRSSVIDSGATVRAVETLRSSAESSQASKGEDRIPLMWRVFGGTLLSIAALVTVTVYQQLTTNLSELRGDLGHLGEDVHKDMIRLNENDANLVKKEEFNSRMHSVWEALKNEEAEKTTVTALKERAAILEEQFKTAEAERKELARELQHLREMKAGDDERKELAQDLQRLRERLAGLEGRQKGDPTAKGPAAGVE